MRLIERPLRHFAQQRQIHRLSLRTAVRHEPVNAHDERGEIIGRRSVQSGCQIQLFGPAACLRLPLPFPMVPIQEQTDSNARQRWHNGPRQYRHYFSCTQTLWQPVLPHQLRYARYCHSRRRYHAAPYVSIRKDDQRLGNHHAHRHRQIHRQRKYHTQCDSQHDIATKRECHAGQQQDGEQQRVAIARLLIRRSLRVILADEPTAALDAGNRTMVIRHLRDFADNGAIVIYTTHNEQTAALADRVIRL